MSYRSVSTVGIRTRERGPLPQKSVLREAGQPRREWYAFRRVELIRMKPCELRHKQKSRNKKQQTRAERTGVRRCSSCRDKGKQTPYVRLTENIKAALLYVPHPIAYSLLPPPLANRSLLLANLVGCPRTTNARLGRSATTTPGYATSHAVFFAHGKNASSRCNTTAYY